MALSQWQKIQIAGLFHDIGKLGERAGIELSQSTQNAESEYCPLNQDRYTHRHVLWTVEFFDKVFGGTLPQDIRDIMKWASLHHQHNLEGEAKFVQDADRISSGHDRGTPKDDYNQQWSKLAVTSFFDVSQNNNKIHQKNEWDQSIFIKPHHCDKYDSLKNLSSEFLDWRNREDREEIHKMHVSIWNDLVKWVKDVWDKYQNNEQLLIFLLCEMQRKYLTWVPAATNTDHPKVSLYDHQRITADFAHCLSENQNKCHYLLVEISGIQKFIYNVYKTKQATKILRGKSTFVELVSEVLTYRLSSLSVSYANIFLNTKGKISYLLPASIKKDEIHGILIDFKNELQKKYGHLIGFEYILKENVDYKQFEKDKFKDFQKEVYEGLHQSKFQPLKRYEDKAWSQINQDKDIQEINGELCRYCKEQEGKLKQDQEENEEDNFICDSCESFIKIGEKDVKHDVRVFSTQKLQGHATKVFEGVYLSYLQADQINKETPNAISKSDSIFSIQVLKESSDFKFLPQNQGYFSTPFKKEGEGDILSFDEMNEKSVYLAIVKADVDDLGNFIIQNPKSTGELASLSHQVQWFFRGRSQQIIQEKYKYKIYPVYLAGDDFFLVGNHNVLPKFLQQIQSEFKSLSYNKLGWSCAYQLFKSSSPLLSLAESVEDDLSHVKNQEGKNQIFLHSEMMKWEELDEMFKMWNNLKEIAEGMENSIGLFRRLLQFSHSARQKRPTRHDLLWPAYYNYYLQRKFPPENGVQNKNFNKIEGIFKVLKDHSNSSLSQFYNQQAIEFHLLDQRQKEEKENELSKSS